MERSTSTRSDHTYSDENLLEGVNIETTERPLGSSLWNTDSTFQVTPYLPSYTVSQSPVSSPSRSASRSQIRAPRRVTSGGPDVPSSETEPTTSSSQFDPPSLRSIFASGQPTSSVSVNTARASMSTASPGSSSRPFAALTNASVNRRRDMRPAEIANASGIMPQHTDYTILGTEKDVDDLTGTHFGSSSDTLTAQNSHALSSLFVTSDRTTPGPLSRATTLGRSASNNLKTLNDMSSLTSHLYQFGYEEGRHSDITIQAFGKSYRLHKLLLDRVPYFSTAFCGPWAESAASEMALMPEDIDPNITQTSFELAIRRIYGTVVPLQEEQEAIGLFATACWLDMPDLVESCIDNVLRQMEPSTLHVLIKLVTNSYYGKAGDRILSSAKAMLYKDGWEMPYEHWDNIPADIIKEIIGGDPFYVPSEWERWFLAIKLLNRRLRKLATDSGLVSPNGKFSPAPSARLRSSALRPGRTTSTRRGRSDSPDDKKWMLLYEHPDVVPLLTLLDTGIHYVHLRFEELQLIGSQKDILGIPILPNETIKEALWMSMELRQKVLNAHEGDLELGWSDPVDTDDEEEEATTPIAKPRSSLGKQRERSQDSVLTSSEAEPIESGRNGRKFWIPNNDFSCVMGGSREAYTTATFITPTESSTPLKRSAATPEVTDSAWAADLGSSLFDTPLSSSRNLIAQALPRYSRYPPFRFCAEFPNPRSLKERKRVYSQTVWYAGSMWNLYIQRVITSKNQQLGIYLHRARDKEPTDDVLALTVDDRIGQLEREMLMRSRSDRRSRQWRTDTFTSLAELEAEEAQNSTNFESLGYAGAGKPGVQPHKTSQSPNQLRSSAPALSISTSSPPGDYIGASDSLIDPPIRNHTVSTIPPYTDTRSEIKTYFKIYSPSKGGRLLSVYESAPDSFNFGKSWGWKCSWMVLDDGLDGKDGKTSMSGDGKLRYMVVIGNV